MKKQDKKVSTKTIVIASIIITAFIFVLIMIYVETQKLAPLRDGLY